MSPLLLIVFAPAMLFGVGLAALAVGAATAGAWESFEGRDEAGNTGEPVSEVYTSPEGRGARAA